MRDSLRITISLLLFSLVLFLLHFYFIERAVISPDWSESFKRIGMAVSLGGALSIFMLPFAERLLAPPWSRIVIWPACLWMGFAYLWIVMLIPLELLHWPASWWLKESSFRRFEYFSVFGVILTGLLVGGFAMFEGLRKPRVRKVRINLQRWPQDLDGYRVVQISDLHIGPIRGARFAKWLAKRINSLSPDMVVVTGDLIDGPVNKIASEVAPLGKISAIDGVHFITGNHDYISGAKSWVRQVESLGWNVLRNQSSWISKSGTGFRLAGVDDHNARIYSREQGEDLNAALAHWNREEALILLAHDPSTFRKAKKHEIDLQISGHTHDGQIWPFRYCVRLLIPWTAGLYCEEKSKLYVSRGTGFWGPPMRLFAPAEITEIVLSSEN